jgi:hypothetical protein
MRTTGAAVVLRSFEVENPLKKMKVWRVLRYCYVGYPGAKDGDRQDISAGQAHEDCHTVEVRQRQRSIERG